LQIVIFGLAGEPVYKQLQIDSFDVNNFKSRLWQDMRAENEAFLSISHISFSNGLIFGIKRSIITLFLIYHR